MFSWSASFRILGRRVDLTGFPPDTGKIKAVTNVPQPQNVKDLQSFLGQCSYFVRFVRRFPTIVTLLHELHLAHTTFILASEQE